MKKSILVLVLISFLIIPVFTEEGVTKKPVAEEGVVDRGPHIEFSVNLIGLFFGTYTGRVEVPLVSSGVVSLGLRGTYTNMDFLGTKNTGFEIIADFRVYPGEYIKDMYFGVQSGYSSLAMTLGGNAPLETASLPVMVVFGQKKVKRNFSFDVGGGIGKKIWLGLNEADSQTLNKFPFNLAYDWYFLIGYQL
ncbi:MAG TPA: hypothetical protein VFC68_04050 [Treponemataceae bacterium]|nr:hypothetical protein [Treponemataceae bacterium]